MYTFVGGIKATFLTDYFHTFVITVIVCFFTIKVWLTPEISSPGTLFDTITQLAVDRPVSGNQGGSYLTMTSRDVSLGLIMLGCALLTYKTGHIFWHYSYSGQLWSRYHGHWFLCQSLQCSTARCSARLHHWRHCVLCHTLVSGYHYELLRARPRRSTIFPNISTLDECLRNIKWIGPTICRGRDRGKGWCSRSFAHSLHGSDINN